MLHNITTNEVHFTIQVMNNGLSACEDTIAIGAIANALHVESNELIVHIDSLASLSYLKYTDKRKANIRLTFNGKNTGVPS
jgi:hypothetical protein